ncbi:MAG: hypothetical protein RIE24_00990 [Silicimonas sp.]
MTRLLAFLLLLAGPAQALSCLPPDAVRLYTQAAESEDLFAIFIGRLDPEIPIEVPEIPNDGTLHEDQEATTRTRLTGHLLGPDDFTRPVDQEIDVRVTCLSIWCGSPITDRDILGALRLTGDVPELEIGPCGSNAMVLEQADLDALLRCHRSGDCTVE